MKKHLGYFLIFALIFAFVFMSLVINISTNLIDWRDYAYVTWIINQNINHLRALNFQNLFNTNAFFPYTNTVFLSDTLITQSIIGLPFSFLTKNPVLIFNLVFFTTFLLNYLSSYLLFNKLLKNNLLSFIGSLAIVFSPFFYTQIGHFQMQNYWPFLLILLLLFKTSSKRFSFDEVLIGFLIAIQFLASVYLAFFGIAAIFIFFLVQIYKGLNIKIASTKFGVIIFTFLILDGIFIKGYMDARKNFVITRGTNEYLVYSAKISDYIFPRQNGFFYQNFIVRKWNTFNNHQFGEPASFPGFILGALAILGLIKIERTKKYFSFHFSVDTSNLFFLCLMLIGLAFSLGYPYLPLAKYIPFFDTTRGTSRWSFLFYIGLIYFSIFYISKIKSKWFLAAAIILLIIDILPAKLTTYKDSYLSSNDETLKSICSVKKTVILEVPVTHFDAGDNIAVGLSYITKRQLASLYNGCYLVNGYSGYDLPSIQQIKDRLISSAQTGNADEFISTVKESNAQLLSINPEAVPPSTLPLLEKTLAKLEKQGKLKHIQNGVYRVD